MREMTKFRKFKNINAFDQKAVGQTVSESMNT